MSRAWILATAEEVDRILAEAITGAEQAAKAEGVTDDGIRWSDIAIALDGIRVQLKTLISAARAVESEAIDA